MSMFAGATDLLKDLHGMCIDVTISMYHVVYDRVLFSAGIYQEGDELISDMKDYRECGNVINTITFDAVCSQNFAQHVCQVKQEMKLGENEILVSVCNADFCHNLCHIDDFIVRVPDASDKDQWQFKHLNDTVTLIQNAKVSVPTEFMSYQNLREHVFKNSHPDSKGNAIMSLHDIFDRY